MEQRLGCGMGYRDEIAQEMEEARSRLDLVEVMAESYLDPYLHDELGRLRDVFGTVLPHGVTLSIGSPGRIPAPRLRDLRRLCDAAAAPYFSDHLAVTHAPGLDLGHLSPICYNEKALQSTIDRVKNVQDALERPLVLENISYYFDLPGNTMSEAEFMHRLTNATGCRFLLDVTNLHANSFNHGFDPLDRLRDYPLHAVSSAHIAGGYLRDGFLVDGHCRPVQAESWQLLATLIDEARAMRAIVLEHDTDFPPLDALLEQVKRAQDLFEVSA